MAITLFDCALTEPDAPPRVRAHVRRVHVTLAMMLQSCGPSCVSDSRLPMALLMVWMSSDDSICLIRIWNGENGGGITNAAWLFGLFPW